MADIVDIAAIKHRVAETRTNLHAAAQDGQERSARVLDLIDLVEKDLIHKRDQIIRLEGERDRAREEVEQLRDLVNELLSVTENAEKRVVTDLGQLLDRLGTLTIEMNSKPSVIP